jgi:hypothetical protein
MLSRRKRPGVPSDAESLISVSFRTQSHFCVVEIGLSFLCHPDRALIFV